MSNDLEQVIKSMPEPSPSMLASPDSNSGANASTSPAQAGAVAASPADKSAVTVDKAGTPFDPARHVADEKGNPIVNRDGRFRLRSGRKSGTPSQPRDTGHGEPVSRLVDPDGPPVDQQGNPLPPPPEPVDYDALAAQVVALEQIGFLTVMGSEWQFQEQESKLLQDAWKKYLQTKGAKELPPWVELSAMHGIIITQRLRQPETQSRLQKFREWIGGMIGRWKARRSGRKAVAAPQQTQKNDAPDWDGV